MEVKIRQRARLLKTIAALIFLGLAWGYAQLEWSTPSSLSHSVVQGRGSILAADGTVLASSVGGERHYPQGPLAGQVVGMMGTQKGLEGIENAYNPQLESGQNITLTLNPRIQAQAEAALARRIPKSGGDSGAVIVLETRTGRILADASYPPFDPNHWRDYQPSDWRNRPLLDVFEPGSPIKGLTVAAALNEGALTPETVFDTPMRRYVGDKSSGSTIGDAVQHPAKLTTTGVLRYSSNVGISHVVERLPGTKLRDYLLAYGYGTDVDLGPVRTETGVLQNENKWDPLVRTTSGFGQGMSGTTLQLAAAYNVLANDGLYIPPKLVEGSEYGQRREVLTHPQARQIKPMLQTALEGIHHAAGINGYSCAGKTGTAQMAGDDGRYMKGQYNSTYAGFCQTVDPRITIAVMVHGAKEASGVYQGSTLAAPIFQEVSAGIISMWGLPPEELPDGYSVGNPAAVQRAQEEGGSTAATATDSAATEGTAAEPATPAENAPAAPASDGENTAPADTDETVPATASGAAGE
ncbi:penicillin-binding protein 2 [Deinococcus sp. Marseille-Q6407]|uniref:peptidoglycan D,D-transpeptidase FtsI family protein n=1 Tax=Deinococcus sp. Marseille-Q6407 TaxID=2969223 RepID=UPI0028FC2265|nr:penicillin-binding protein 2 [Deinococcus sp. Marseille-Q6407]